jgi:hypothetical protein
MTDTILSASYANPDHDAAVIETAERGAVMISAADTPEAWAEMLAWGAPAAYAPPPLPVPVITRTQCLLWLWRERGKTEADVDAAIAAISDANARMEAQIVWKNARDLHHDHPLFITLAPPLGIEVAALPDFFRAASLLLG